MDGPRSGIACFAALAACLRIGIRSPVFLSHTVLRNLAVLPQVRDSRHAAGVLVAAVVPSEPRIHRRDYAAAVEVLLRDFKLAMEDEDDEKAEAIAEEIEGSVAALRDLWSASRGSFTRGSALSFCPSFALANAGIVFTSETLSEAVASRVTLGIATALLLGNAIGVSA